MSFHHSFTKVKHILTIKYTKITRWWASTPWNPYISLCLNPLRIRPTLYRNSGILFQNSKITYFSINLTTTQLYIYIKNTFTSCMGFACQQHHQPKAKGFVSWNLNTTPCISCNQNRKCHMQKCKRAHAWAFQFLSKFGK